MDESVELDAFGAGVVLQELWKVHKTATSPHNAASVFELHLPLVSADQVLAWR